MAKIPLTKDKEFVVGEEKLLNYILAALFLGLFLYGLLDAINRNFKKIDYQSYVFCLAILPVVYCLRRAHSGRIYLRVNKTGIYQDEKLVTRWPGFIHAQIAQKEKTSFFNIQDNFILIVEHKEEGKGYRRKIPLTNTQNRSEEDVLAAINFFWKIYRMEAGQRN